MRNRKLLSIGAALCALACGLFSGVALAAGPPAAPVTEAASGMTSSSAVLNGTLNPNTKALTGWYFAYSTEPACTGGPTTPLEPEVEVQAQQEHFEVTGLEPHKQYSFCLVAANTTGETTETTAGSALTFDTLDAKPAIDSEGTSNVSSSGATLEAQVNPENEQTSYSFQYATGASGETLTNPTNLSGGTLSAGFGDQLASASIDSGLSPGITYYYRAIAENATGRTAGPVQAFTTTARPLVGAGAAEDPTRTTILLSGSVNPQGAPTIYHFVLISDAAYQSALREGSTNPYAAGRSTPRTEVGSDFASHPTGQVLVTELAPATTYHYALVAINQDGTTISPDDTFTTSPPTPPLIETGGASNVSQNTATVAGTVNTQGLQTTYGFEIGTSTNYGPPTGLGGVGAGAAEAPIALNLTGLQPGVTYHYRITATNIDGTSYGVDHTFTTSVFANVLATPPAPLPFLSVPAIAFPAADKGTGRVTVKTLTRAQKLANALRACRKKPKSGRAACERAARSKYGLVKRKK